MSRTITLETLRSKLAFKRESILSLARDWLGIDYRSLAAFRVGLGISVMGDLLIRGWDLRAHYTDFGVLPRVVQLSRWTSYWDISLHWATGSVEGQLLIFLLHGLAALFLLLGYKTWWANFWAWLLTVSLINRNPMVNHSGDIILRLLLFWSLFLPLGKVWSLDSRGEKKEDRLYFSAGGTALLLQIAFIYWFAVLLKSGVDWIPDGTASFYALHIDQFATRPAIWLRQYKDFLRFNTYAVWYWELIGPFLLLAPLPALRLLAIAGFVLMHLGFELFLGIGIFPLFDLVSMLPFLPSGFWNWFQGKKAFRCPVVKGKNQFLEVFCMLMLIFVFAWNLTTIQNPPIHIPGALIPLSRIMGLEQRWGMFAPNPLKEDGWYVIPGKFEDGKVTDLFNGLSPPAWSKPELVSAMYGNERWQKYLMNLYIASNHEHREFYGRWLCYDWNRKLPKGKRLVEFDIYFNLEKMSLEGKSPPQRALLQKVKCPL